MYTHEVGGEGWNGYMGYLVYECALRLYKVHFRLKVTRSWPKIQIKVQQNCVNRPLDWHKMMSQTSKPVKIITSVPLLLHQMKISNHLRMEKEISGPFLQSLD